MQRVSAGLALLLTISPAIAADVDAETRANKAAYDAAIQCFAANAVVAADWGRDGNPAKKAAYEAKARESFDIATNAGSALGYSGTRINQDFGLAQAQEVPRLMTDRTYFKRATATCKSLGLM